MGPSWALNLRSSVTRETLAAASRIRIVKDSNVRVNREFLPPECSSSMMTRSALRSFISIKYRINAFQTTSR
jgi:hypothetical protein